MKSTIVALLMVATAACSTSRNDPNIGLQPEQTAVEVDNRGFIDMTVYVMRSSQRMRLGTAVGNRKTKFALPQGLVTGVTTLRFVADPIGGARASVSEEISVTPGDTVGLLIPPS